MEFKTAYIYDETTKEFIQQTIAQENPKHDGEYIMPINSTFSEPPASQEGYARVWSGETWTQVEDHRGQTIWQNWQTSRMVTELGPIPQGWSLVQPEKPATKQSLCEFLYNQKYSAAYSGIIVIKNGVEYIFSTSQDSITMCNSEKLEFLTDETKTSTDWKVYQNGFPVLLRLTKNQFVQALSFAKSVISTAFGVEGEFNAQVQSMTEDQIQNKEFTDNFKAAASSAFSGIDRRFEITANMN